MATGISSGSQLQELVALAKRRVWQVLLPAVLTGSLGVMAGSLMPAKYSSKTTMELVAVPPTLAAAGLDSKSLRDRVQAANFTLKTNERMDEVLSSLEWEHYQSLPPDERRVFIKRVVNNLWIRTKTPAGTNLLFIEFEYQDTDPQRAAQFANELRDYFVRGLIEDVRKKAVALLERMQKDLLVANELYEDSSRTLQDLRKDHNISPTQSFSQDARQREQDPLFAELQREKSEQTRVSKQVKAQLQQREDLQLRLEGMPEMVKESETQIGGLDLNSKIEELRKQIATERARQIGKKPAHSDYRQAQKQIEELERQIALLEGRTVGPTRIVNEVPNPDRKLLEDQIAELDLSIRSQRSLLDSIQQNIAELTPLLADRTEVYANIDREFERFNRARFSVGKLSAEKDNQRRLVDNLSLPDFSPFDVTEEALPPTRPSSPSALFVVAAGIVLGVALGVLFVLLAEFGRNAYRNPADLSRSLPAPVLGAINQISTARERRGRAFRSGLVGASTLILAGSILWVTWAFHSRPGLLGPELTDWLDDVRGQLR